MISNFQNFSENIYEDATIKKSGVKNVNDFKDFVEQRVKGEINGENGPDKDTPEGQELSKITDKIQKNVDDIEQKKSELSKDVDDIKKNVDKTVDKAKDFDSNIKTLQKEKDKL
jgi:peptidoglycan hydrolase CwlO-like protein